MAPGHRARNVSSIDLNIVRHFLMINEGLPQNVAATKNRALLQFNCYPIFIYNVPDTVVFLGKSETKKFRLVF